MIAALDPDPNVLMEDNPEKTNILIVDDRPDKLLSLRTMLGDLNENLVCVRSGNEALREILRRDFAVILLDVNMPDMDGFETAALIRRRVRSETTPIIFISAVNDAETHVSRGYSLGAVDYILTPVIPEILRAKIAVFVDLFRKTEAVKRQAEEHARFIHEQAARLEAVAAQERFAFLAEAGSVLAGSLDYDETYQNLARLIVPRLAEFCVIEQIDGSGDLRPVAAVHFDPVQAPLLGGLNSSGNGEGRGCTLRVHPSIRPELRNGVAAESIGNWFSEHWVPLMTILDPTSFIAVPIVARGSTIGAMTMFRTVRSTPYTLTELSLAEELAQRAALAIDNAKLYLAAHRARAEAEAANHSKDRFLAMLSHELRTPLTPVLASILNLQAEQSLPPQVRNALMVMRRNVELEARLIDDLLDLTRVASGNIRLSREVVNAHCLLKNAIEICRPDIQAKNLTLEVDLNATEVFVDGDPARMQQILWNLIRNAMKFTMDGGIRLTTRNDSGRLHIQVIDTGIGIAPEFLGKMFLPFEQGEKGQFGGLGLGLSISKALAELHGGSISVESEGRGRGTTFLLEFPVTEAPSQSDSVVVEADAGSSPPLRILLVEDHPDTNQSLTLLLELRGYTVFPALDVQSAVKLAEENEVDVIISDIGLPDGNAGEAMKVVAERYSAVGIALSGFGMEDDLRTSRGFGFSHHLVKPVDLANLENILRGIANVL